MHQAAAVLQQQPKPFTASLASMAQQAAAPTVSALQKPQHQQQQRQQQDKQADAEAASNKLNQASGYTLLPSACCMGADTALKGGGTQAALHTCQIKQDAVYVRMIWLNS